MTIFVFTTVLKIILEEFASLQFLEFYSKDQYPIRVQTINLRSIPQVLSLDARVMPTETTCLDVD